MNIKHQIETLLAGAEERFNQSKSNSWQKDEAAGEIKAYTKVLELMETKDALGQAGGKG